MEIMSQYKADFGESFSENKKTLDKVSIIRSKGLKNEIAGFITKFIKNEIREQKDKAYREKQNATRAPSTYSDDSKAGSQQEEETPDPQVASSPEEATQQATTPAEPSKPEAQEHTASDQS